MSHKLPFTVFEGEGLLTIQEDTAEPLIEGLLYKQDFVQLIAEDKMGKTILCLQMAASLSSGTPFLGIFDIPEAVPIWYFSHEGKSFDMQDRLKRISELAPINTDNFVLFCGSKFRWNEEGNEPTFDWLMETYKDRLPKVIFIDPLYAASVGDLNANAPMKDFIHVVRTVAEACGSAVVLIHHMKKNQRDDNGNYYSRNDSDGYGSAAFKWAVDHVLYLDKFKYADKDTYDKDNPDRFLKCNTQRSNKIANGLRLSMYKETPLGFYVVEKHIEGQHRILAVLKNKPQGLDATALMKLTNIKSSTFYTIRKELLESEQIAATKTRPVMFKLKEKLDV